ncbi:SDR family NAD(P)-dependent oxidoreductase [Micromonospora sp. BRA006-A]|nr:SDR family NAD(P)-dependent oxidoreductase [Micromonospora sp. BRA006-A]
MLTGSVLGHITAPYVSGYVAAKWGLQGLARTLQQEARETPGVAICLVNPGSVDTPVYRQAANYLGRVGRPPPPIASPERVARAIVGCLDRPRRGVGGPAQRGHALRLHRPARRVRRAGRSADAPGRADPDAGRRAPGHRVHAQPGR